MKELPSALHYSLPMCDIISACRCVSRLPCFVSPSSRAYRLPDPVPYLDQSNTLLGEIIEWVALFVAPARHHFSLPLREPIAAMFCASIESRLPPPRPSSFVWAISGPIEHAFRRDNFKGLAVAMARFRVLHSVVSS